jgi:hypothetical protein
MGVLSEIDGQASCYPAFPLVVLLHKSYKDEVNWQPCLPGESSKPPLRAIPYRLVAAPGLPPLQLPMRLARLEHLEHPMHRNVPASSYSPRARALAARSTARTS